IAATGPELGKGIYTRRDIAAILRMPYGKVNRWVTEYGQVSEAHFWKVGDSLAVDFITLVELAVVGPLMDDGVKPARIVKAREILQRHFGIDAPFAQKQVLEAIATDGRHIYFRFGNQDLVNLDGTGQLNLD